MHRFTSFIKAAKWSISCLEKKLMYFLCKKFAKIFQRAGALYLKNTEVTLQEFKVYLAV